MKLIAILVILFSLFNVEVSYAKDKPIGGLCGGSFVGSNTCVWNEDTHEWTETYVGWDNWEWQAISDQPERADTIRRMHLPRQVPVEKKYSVSLNTEACLKPEYQLLLSAAVLLPSNRKPITASRRVVIINVEGGDWPEESRIWPHLGINYVGTVAKQEGYEVVLYDELIQGRKPLKEIVRPGDIVGLSLVTTGIERGVIVAQEAKVLGACYVIAGNDSAMFRARQLLELPGRPIDAVFTSNSVVTIREFFRNADAVIADSMQIEQVATAPEQVPYVSNEHDGVALERKAYTAEDFFLVPDLSLFSDEYWELVRAAYRSQFGHKHQDSANVHNAIALLAQGCGRAGMGDICDYCTIRHVANVVQPSPGYLEETLATYRAHGVNTFFNVTDSAFEMGVLAKQLEEAGPVDTLIIYGRAQAIAQRPDLLERWKSCVSERLLINCGMDSGDERILQTGIHKSGSKVGSRLQENYRTLANIKAAGPKVHLHFSVIFGSPGETHESCEATLQFVQHAIDTLGEQLDVVEGDVFWVNFGAPCSEIFTNYEATQKRAALAGKTISQDEWQQCFGRHADELVVPEESQQAWYAFFTNITIEDAWAYNAQVREMLTQVPGHITGREYAFRPPTV
ncbi:MAG: hypothetical protein AB202_01080 [Parcubacteria bacterium C7867-007]|nr:MAG: hypothetical protein AB202_01080 [Parcubacteria bacterium C7867-007]